MLLKTLGCLAIFGNPSFACTNSETQMLEYELGLARDAVTTALDYAGDTPTFVRNFGPYDTNRADRVRSVLNSLASHLLIGTIDFRCVADATQCDAGAFACVDKTDAYVVYIPPAFFTLNTLLTPQVDLPEDYGTMGGAIIHEVSHFEIVDGTMDPCYGRFGCSQWAQDNPDLAVTNADSFQYFAEEAYWRL